MSNLDGNGSGKQQQHFQTNPSSSYDDQQDTESEEVAENPIRLPPRFGESGSSSQSHSTLPPLPPFSLSHSHSHSPATTTQANSQNYYQFGASRQLNHPSIMTNSLEFNSSFSSKNSPSNPHSHLQRVDSNSSSSKGSNSISTYPQSQGSEPAHHSPSTSTFNIAASQLTGQTSSTSSNNNENHDFSNTNHFHHNFSMDLSPNTLTNSELSSDISNLNDWSNKHLGQLNMMGSADGMSMGMPLNFDIGNGNGSGMDMFNNHHLNTQIDGGFHMGGDSLGLDPAAFQPNFNFQGPNFNHQFNGDGGFVNMGSASTPQEDKDQEGSEDELENGNENNGTSSNKKQRTEEDGAVKRLGLVSSLLAWRVGQGRRERIRSKGSGAEIPFSS